MTVTHQSPLRNPRSQPPRRRRWPRRVAIADSLRSAFHHQDRVTDQLIDETWGWFSRPENREAFWMLVRNLDFARTDARLNKVESDTLILWGGQDRWLPASQATELAERIPNATARVLPGCGHNVHEDCPAQAVPLLTSFLTGLNR